MKSRDQTSVLLSVVSVLRTETTREMSVITPLFKGEPTMCERSHNSSWFFEIWLLTCHSVSGENRCHNHAILKSYMPSKRCELTCLPKILLQVCRAFKSMHLHIPISRGFAHFKISDSNSNEGETCSSRLKKSHQLLVIQIPCCPQGTRPCVEVLTGCQVKVGYL